ncbi:hypothetical protein CSUB01_07532 [Colletotrichum sublineola]|uniref:Uncharacterized protein n=1 Tax=Colletotrichum sublineola TaxID=1173701 RepID=A0A066XJ36_COLSU|nr:hypothetical protein CSUB01_07532 [Colletotrichum sublineola]
MRIITEAFALHQTGHVNFVKGINQHHTRSVIGCLIQLCYDCISVPPCLLDYVSSGYFESILSALDLSCVGEAVWHPSAYEAILTYHPAYAAILAHYSSYAAILAQPFLHNYSSAAILAHPSAYAAILTYHPAYAAILAHPSAYAAILAYHPAYAAVLTHHSFCLTTSRVAYRGAVFRPNKPTGDASPTRPSIRTDTTTLILDLQKFSMMRILRNINHSCHSCRGVFSRKLQSALNTFQPAWHQVWIEPAHVSQQLFPFLPPEKLVILSGTCHDQGNQPLQFIFLPRTQERMLNALAAVVQQNGMRRTWLNSLAPDADVVAERKPMASESQYSGLSSPKLSPSLTYPCINSIIT